MDNVYANPKEDTAKAIFSRKLAKSMVILKLLLVIVGILLFFAFHRTLRQHRVLTGLNPAMTCVYDPSHQLLETYTSAIHTYTVLRDSIQVLSSLIIDFSFGLTLFQW